ncbi:hypothetical protein CBER1_05209 [Cercospora berteroae]|uniref:Uncharacterized protein n=1 Tax=Cercospora berteroae TaxID=357750 RepID=A0A2S6BRX1_9PEZI|nr:hypothetical protein CBER1_05209 [Cercospora berteroae]
MMGLKRSADGPSSPNKRQKGEDAEPIARSAVTFPAPESRPDKETAQSTSDSILHRRAEEAELRNKIYEYALIEGVITATSSLKPPGALAVCRQIRREAKLMWMKQNHFIFHVHHCAAQLALRFRQVFRAVKWNMLLYKEANWQNLLQWCKDVYETRKAPLLGAAESKPFGSFVVGMLHQAKNSRAKSWKECEKDLVRWRAAGGAIDPAWLND